MLALLYVAPVLLAGPWVVSASPGAIDQEFRGQMTDDMCGKAHTMEGLSPAACARECVSMGAKYALFVPEDARVYRLDDQERAGRFAGRQVVVTGTLNEDGKVIRLSTIKAAESN